MRAVVLVGGFGTRLRPLTNTTPKPLLPVGHRPILAWVLDNLARAGITEAVLSLGFRPDAFAAVYPDDRCGDVRLVYAVEPEPLDTAGAIRFAAESAGVDDTFVVVNGDVLTDLDVAALVRFHAESGAEGTIHLTPVNDPSSFGVVPTDENGLVLAFIEKPVFGEAPTNLINGGTYVLEPTVLERIGSGQKVSIERSTFPAMVADRVLYAMATHDYWLDAGQPQQYLDANLDLLDGRRPAATIAAVAPSAVVDPASTVERSMIGAGARVCRGACVRDSVLLPGVSIGDDATVTRSLLGKDAVIGAGASLDASVIGDGEVVAPGRHLVDARVPAPA
jgi:mannose-1-phosphate guanylyltransferase